MSMIVPIVVRLLGLAGVNISPFAAGALFAGVLALLAGGGALAGSLHLYNAGYASADTKCASANLQAQIDTLEADRDIARTALVKARLKVAELEKQSDDDKRGTADYVEDHLKKRYQAACAITDDDLRGLRARTGADSPAKGAAAGAGVLDAARRGAARLKGR